MRRFFYALCALVAGCGGGGDDQPLPKVLTVPDVVLTEIDSRLAIADIPQGFQADQRISFTVTSEDYFSQNPDGHFAVITRADLSKWTTQVLGHGLAFGNLAQAPNGTPSNPGVQIESWCNGSTPGNYLLSAPTAPVLRDGVPYQVQLDTHVSPDRSEQTVRYRLSVSGQQVYDSGLISDPNRGFDPSMNSVWIGHVFDNPNAGLWLIRLSNIKIELS